MSIFGYLSKAHMDAGLVSGESVAALQIIDEKITTQRGNIDQDKKALTQMDASVNEMMSRTTDANGISKAMHYRKSQSAERKSLDADILIIQASITKLQTERTPIAASVRKNEAEVGPIKYIANLIYGDNIDSTLLEKAVRIVILMIVSVFDPLAMLILIAANWNQKYQASLPKIPKVKYETQEACDEVKEEVLTHEFASQDMIDESPVFVPVSVSNPDDIHPRIKVNDDLSWEWIDKIEEDSFLSAEPMTDVEFTEYVKPTEILEPKLTPTEIICWPTEIFDESAEITKLIYASDPIAEVQKYYEHRTINLANYVIVSDDVRVVVS